MKVKYTGVTQYILASNHLLKTGDIVEVLSHVSDPMDRMKIGLCRKEVAEVLKQAYIKFNRDINALTQ